MKNNQVTIIAGPCSVDQNNRGEIEEIARIEVVNKNGEKQRAIGGVRVVGLKSRTSHNPSGQGMGVDYEAFMENSRRLMNAKKPGELLVPPSVSIAKDIIERTGVFVATEVMSPTVQLPLYEEVIGKGNIFLWNPAVNQLGWAVLQTAMYAKKNNWQLGLKNPKWIGEDLAKANSKTFTGQTTMEKTWIGLNSFAEGANGDLALIHRGVDVGGKANYRNVPVHEIARRVKEQTGKKLFFDPSHSYGPKMRDDIVEAIVQAMQMRIDEYTYLYDGVLVEAGTSETDTEQHITLKELKTVAGELAKLRDLMPPKHRSAKKAKTMQTVVAKAL